MNIYLKMNKIMEEVKSLEKDGKVAFGNTKYAFLSEAKTTTIFREKLIENKLVLFPIKVTDSKEGNVTQGHYVYRLLNAEEPSEFIDIETTGQGQDSSDKGSGKASSYAYKYLLWRTFAVPSNDDPDNVSSAETVDKDQKALTKKMQQEIAAAEKEDNKEEDSEIGELKLLIKETSSSLEDILKHYKSKSLEDLTDLDRMGLKKLLLKRKG